MYIDANSHQPNDLQVSFSFKMADKKLKDNLSRVKAPSPLGKSIFVGLRLTDAVWQYAFLYRGWASQLVQRFGGTSLQVLHASSGRLNPYYQLLVVMALGSGLKQAIHMALISEQELSSGLGFGIGLFNTVFNSTNILLSVWSLTSQSPSSDDGSLRIQSTASVAIGVCAYTVGILTELISELQRRRFKKDPNNKGKPYGGGLFSLATNVNYGAYTLWRAGFALATGSWAWGLFNFSFFFYDFATRGVPVLDEYCTQRVCLFFPLGFTTASSCLLTTRLLVWRTLDRYQNTRLLPLVAVDILDNGRKHRGSNGSGLVVSTGGYINEIRRSRVFACLIQIFDCVYGISFCSNRYLSSIIGDIYITNLGTY